MKEEVIFYGTVIAGMNEGFEYNIRRTYTGTYSIDIENFLSKEKDTETISYGNKLNHYELESLEKKIQGFFELFIETNFNRIESGISRDKLIDKLKSEFHIFLSNLKVSIQNSNDEGLSFNEINLIEKSFDICGFIEINLNDENNLSKYFEKEKGDSFKQSTKKNILELLGRNLGTDQEFFVPIRFFNDKKEVIFIQNSFEIDCDIMKISKGQLMNNLELSIERIYHNFKKSGYTTFIVFDKESGEIEYVSKNIDDGNDIFLNLSKNGDELEIIIYISNSSGNDYESYNTK